MNNSLYRINRFLQAFVFCLLPLCVSAQSRYTLDECIDLALQNNVRTKNAENDLRMAEQQRQSAFTRYFPSVSATGTGFLADKGLLEMDMGGQRTSLMKNGVAGGVSATVPLFTGGQIVQGNKLARVNVEVSRLRRRQSEDEVRLAVEQYFWQVVMLKEKLRTLDAVQVQLERLCQDVEAAVEAGVTNRNDLLQVQLRKNETRSTTLSVKNALGVSLSLLGQYIGHASDSIDVALELDGALPPNPDSLYRLPKPRSCSPPNTICWTSRWMPTACNTAWPWGATCLPWPWAEATCTTT